MLADTLIQFVEQMQNESQFPLPKGDSGSGKIK